MTSSLLFLLFALAISVVGSLVLWLRYHQPTSVEHGIEQFAREMRALAPDRPGAVGLSDRPGVVGAPDRPGAEGRDRPGRKEPGPG